MLPALPPTAPPSWPPPRRAAPRATTPTLALPAGSSPFLPSSLPSSFFNPHTHTHTHARTRAMTNHPLDMCTEKPDLPSPMFRAMSTGWKTWTPFSLRTKRRIPSFRRRPQPATCPPRETPAHPWTWCTAAVFSAACYRQQRGSDSSRFRRRAAPPAASPSVARREGRLL